MSCPVLSSHVLSSHVLSSHVLSCPIQSLYYSDIMTYAIFTVLYVKGSLLLYKPVFRVSIRVPISSNYIYRIFCCWCCDIHFTIELVGNVISCWINLNFKMNLKKWKKEFSIGCFEHSVLCRIGDNALYWTQYWHWCECCLTVQTGKSDLSNNI